MLVLVCQRRGGGERLVVLLLGRRRRGGGERLVWGGGERLVVVLLVRQWRGGGGLLVLRLVRVRLCRRWRCLLRLLTEPLFYLTPDRLIDLRLSRWCRSVVVAALAAAVTVFRATDPLLLARARRSAAPLSAVTPLYPPRAIWW